MSLCLGFYDHILYWIEILDCQVDSSKLGFSTCSLDHLPIRYYYSEGLHASEIQHIQNSTPTFPPSKEVPLSGFLEYTIGTFLLEGGLNQKNEGYSSLASFMFSLSLSLHIYHSEMPSRLLSLKFVFFPLHPQCPNA